MKNILILNGSIRGEHGNSGRLAIHSAGKLKAVFGVNPIVITLSQIESSAQDLHNLLIGADGFLIISGTYWNSWGSCLQRFIEAITPFENSKALFGKPIACAVTIDSVGGIEVAARLHAVFSGLGCWSPPCSTIVLSRVGNEAIEASGNISENPNDDVWRLDDLDIVLENLVKATAIKNEWACWPHISLKTSQDPLKKGDMNLGSPIFIP